MSDITKVIIAFAALIVVGAGIIGYGIWRKVDKQRAQEAVLRQAHTMCDTMTESFVQMDAEAREDLLGKADRLKGQIKGFDDVETGEAEALTTWLRERRDVHGRLSVQERKLRGALSPLQFTPPVDADEQLSTQDLQRLRQAIASATEIMGKPLLLPGGGSVTTATAFPTQTRQIGKRVGELQAEMDKRERAYTAFLTRHGGALTNAKGGSMPEEDVKKNVDELQKWLALVQKCPQKLAELDKMKTGWDDIVKSGEKIKAVRDRLDTVMKDLRTSMTTGRTGAARDMVIAQGKAVLDEAKRLNAPALQPLIIQLEDMIKTSDPNSRQAKERETLVAQIIADNAKLSSAMSSLEKRKLERDIQSGVDRLKVVAPMHGEFFGKVLASRHQKEADALVRKAILEDLGLLKTTSSYQRMSRISQIESNIRKLQSTDPDLAALLGEVLIERRKSSGSSSGTTPGPGTRYPTRSPSTTRLTNLKASVSSLLRTGTNLKDADTRYFSYTGSSSIRKNSNARALHSAISDILTEIGRHAKLVSAMSSL